MPSLKLSTQHLKKWISWNTLLGTNISPPKMAFWRWFFLFHPLVGYVSISWLESYLSLLGIGLYLQLSQVCCLSPWGAKILVQSTGCKHNLLADLSRRRSEKTRYWSLTVKPLKIGLLPKWKIVETTIHVFWGRTVKLWRCSEFVGFFHQPVEWNRLFDGLFL